MLIYHIYKELQIMSKENKELEKVDFNVIEALNTYQTYLDSIDCKCRKHENYQIKHKYTSILDFPKPKNVKEVLSKLQKYVGIEDPKIAEYYVFLIANSIISSVSNNSNSRLYFIRYDSMYDLLKTTGLNFMKLQNYDKYLVEHNYAIHYTNGICLSIATIKKCITDNTKFSCECPEVSEFINLLNTAFFDYTAARDNENMASWTLIDMFLGYEKSFIASPAVSELRDIIPDECFRFYVYALCVSYKFEWRKDIGFLSKSIKHPASGHRLLSTLRKKENCKICNFLKIENASTVNDDTTIEFTDEGLEFFRDRGLALYTPNTSNTGDAEIIRAKDIRKKELFYSPSVTNQICQIKNSLKNLGGLQKRLKSEGYNTGVNVLMYGLPGTGKTETAYQIAKELKRDILMVDMSATKSCWFGESEKIVKNIFKSYRDMCTKSKPKDMPILLLNEADALLGKRKDVNTSNVAQTENAIQNIILQEMEVSTGIILATTNMVENLDAAFERRFLFKIKFENPTLDAKKSIWNSKMPKLSDEDTSRLAEKYNFSGGQIDNICRKAIMNYITTGQEYDYNSINEYCKVESIGGAEERHIGFDID